MSFLLDTIVVSEWTKPRPDPGVVAFLSEADEGTLYLSVVTLAELRRGIDRLAQGQRRARLDQWLREDLPMRFDSRLLGIDAAIADMWGRLIAARESAGHPLGTMDGWIAATAEVHGLILATRNVADFTGSVQQVIDPWRGT